MPSQSRVLRSAASKERSPTSYILFIDCQMIPVRLHRVCTLMATLKPQSLSWLDCTLTYSLCSCPSIFYFSTCASVWCPCWFSPPPATNHAAHLTLIQQSSLQNKAVAHHTFCLPACSVCWGFLFFYFSPLLSLSFLCEPERITSNNSSAPLWSSLGVR